MKKYIYIIIHLLFLCNSVYAQAKGGIWTVTSKTENVNFVAQKLSIDSTFLHTLVSCIQKEYFIIPPTHFTIYVTHIAQSLYSIRLDNDGYPPHNGDEYKGFVQDEHCYFWIPPNIPIDISPQVIDTCTFSYQRIYEYYDGVLFDDIFTFFFIYDANTKIVKVDREHL